MAKASTKPASKRVLFTQDDTALPLPNLIAHQTNSWKEFVEKYHVSYEYIGFARQQVAVRITGIGQQG